MVFNSYRRRFHRFQLWLTAFTFIGVVVHEVAHNLACRWFSLRIGDTCYFQFGQPAGYVEHEYPKRFHHSLAVSTAPFLLNTLVGLTASYIAISIVTTVDLSFSQWPPAWTPITTVVLGWVGFSAALHSIPSTGDAAHLWDHTKKSLPWNPLVLVFLPIILIVELLNVLKYAGIDLVYACMVIAVAYFLSLHYPVLDIFPWWVEISPRARPLADTLLRFGSALGHRL